MALNINSHCHTFWSHNPNVYNYLHTRADLHLDSQSKKNINRIYKYSDYNVHIYIYDATILTPACLPIMIDLVMAFKHLPPILHATLILQSQTQPGPQLISMADLQAGTVRILSHIEAKPPPCQAGWQGTTIQTCMGSPSWPAAAALVTTDGACWSYWMRKE